MTTFALFLTRQRLVQSIFITASALVVISMVGIFAMAVFLWLGIPELPVRIVLHSLFGVILHTFRAPFVSFLDNTKRGWWLLCSVPVFLIVNFLFITAIPVSLERNPANMPYALILCLTTIVIYVTLVFILRMAYKESQLEQNLAALNMAVSALEHQNEIIHNNEQQMLILRHDMRHVVQMMSVCANNGDINGVREVLTNLDDNLSNKLNGTMTKAITGHKLIDITLNYYINMAKESGIDITASVDCMDNIKTNKTELAVVVSNALENAVIACRKISNNENRFMRVNGRQQGKQFFMEIANTYVGEIDFDSATGLPVSREENHGFGSRGIAFFAQKYSVSLEYLVENGWFYLRLLLP